MAKDKSSFVLYTDLIHTLKKMAKAPNGKQQVGELFITILEYVNDQNPTPEDPMVEIAFEPIKQQMKRDLRKYERTVESKKEGAAMGNLKRWNPDLHQSVLDEKMTLQAAIFKADERKAALVAKSGRICDNSVAPHRRSDASIADSDSVNGNGSVKENIDSRKLKFASTLKPFLEKYGKDLLNDFYKYWTEPNASNTKFRKELEKTWSLERRLENWAKNDKKFIPTTTQAQTPKQGLA